MRAASASAGRDSGAATSKAGVRSAVETRAARSPSKRAAAGAPVTKQWLSVYSIRGRVPSVLRHQMLIDASRETRSL